MKTKMFLAAAVLSTASLYAQDSTSSLQAVVVTANKYPVKQTLTGKVITVIDKAMLERSWGKSVGEVLGMQAGVVVNGSNSALGTNQDVYVRGASAGKTLIMIDGVPLYDAGGISGAYDLNLISTEMVERIEILKGSYSALYGSDAIAGVINIITKKSAPVKIQPSLHLAAGSYGTFKGMAGLSGTVSGTTYNVQYAKQHSKGFSTATDPSGKDGFEKDGFDQDAIKGTLTHRVSGKLTLKANGAYSRYDADLDADRFTDDADYTVKTNNLLAGAGAEAALGKGMLFINYSYNKIERTYRDDSLSVGGFTKYSEGKYTGFSHYAEAYLKYPVGQHASLLFGTDYRRQATDQYYYSLSSFGPYNTALGDTAKVNQLGVYASLFIQPKGPFSLDIGGRYDNFNKYGDVFTFSINPSVRITEAVKLFANVGTGFKTPSLYQVFGEYRNPNTELKPEQSLGIDAGLSYTRDKTSLRADYFIRNLKDNVVFYSAGAPNYESYYINADKQKDKGFELEADVQFGKLRLIANYTNLDGYVETTTGTKDTSFFNLYRRPQQSIQLNGIISVCKDFEINMGLQTIGRRYEPVYGSAPEPLAAYYVWNLYAAYNLGKKARVYVDLKNITGERYEELRGFSTRGFNVMSGVALTF